MEPSFNLSTSTSYRFALLWLMDQLGSAETSRVLQEFEQRLGHLIPPHHRTLNPSGKVRWVWYVYWSRQHLVAAGLMGGAGRGVWAITEAGRAWLREHSDGDQEALAALLKRALNEKLVHRDNVVRRRIVRERTEAASVAGSITLEKLERIKSVLPAEQFRQDWGEEYDRLLAAERARMITPVTAREIGERAQRIVRRVQDFLSGKSTEAPTHEVICSWIHTCYVLELYREAAALLKYLGDQDGPSLGSYARRLAEASRARLGW